MATEMKYVASLDSTALMAGIHEVRSQLGMALGSATGFQNAAMAMFGSPNLGGSGFGHTFTNAAMAYSPHYGAIQAQTTLEQEMQVKQFGLAAAQQLKPPGVSPASYAMAAISNAIDRDVSAKQEATSAARAAFFTGAGGLAAGEVAAVFAGAPLGAMLGGAVGKRFFGGGAVKAGRGIGGVVGAYAAFEYAREFVGGKIEEHFAEIEQIGGVTRELGELAGGGRGLSRTQRYDLGIAARKAAGDLNMDVQQMGEVLALGRESGMMPTAIDPNKAREQFRDFARAIEEGTQILQTSLAGATQVIKQAAQQGMSATQAITQAAGAGGADIWLAQQARMNAFGAAGAATGRGMGFTGAQGRGLFMGGLGAGAAAGMSGEEMKIMGGRFGAGAFVGQTQMAMAASPMGDLQLMAAMGGGGDGTMLGLAGAAMSGLMGEGGDFLSNAIRFQVHKNEYRRGIGAKGIRTMAREQLRMGGEMIQMLGVDISDNDAQRMYAISIGMDPDRAKVIVGGGRGGGGRRRREMAASAVAKAAMARSESDLGVAGMLSDAEIESQVADSPSGFEFGDAVSFGITGAIMGKGAFSIPLAIGGAIAGFGIQNYGAIKGMFSDGPAYSASTEEKADYYQKKATTEYDQRIDKAEESLGLIDTNEEEIRRALTTDLSLARLDLDAEGPSTGLARTAGMLAAAGLESVEAGKGTMGAGGVYRRLSDVQKLAKSLGTGISKKQSVIGRRAAFLTSTAEGGFHSVRIENKNWYGVVESVDIYESDGSSSKLRKGILAQMEKVQSGMRPGEAGDALVRLVRSGIAGSGDEELQKAAQDEGLYGGTVTSYLTHLLGINAEEFREKMAGSAARALGAAHEGNREMTLKRGGEFIAGLMGVRTSKEDRDRDRDKKQVSATRSSFRTELGKKGFLDFEIESIMEKGDASGLHYMLRGAVTDRKIYEARAETVDTGHQEVYGDGGGSNVQDEGREAFALRFVEKIRESGLGARLSGSAGNTKAMARNKRKHQALWIDTYLEDPEAADLAGVERDAPGLYEKVYKRGSSPKDAALGVASAVAEGIVDLAKGYFTGEGDGVKGIMETVKLAITSVETTTQAEEFADDKERHETPIKSKGKGKRGSGTLQNASGYGERESAMASINKSLRHTERMLKITHGRISKLEKAET